MKEEVKQSTNVCYKDLSFQKGICKTAILEEDASLMRFRTHFYLGVRESLGHPNAFQDKVKMAFAHSPKTFQ